MGRVPAGRLSGSGQEQLRRLGRTAWSLFQRSSSFIAVLGSTHDRVTDERATPLLRHLYSGGYLGGAHLLCERQQVRDVQANPTLLREFREILLGDPFADAE